MSNFNQNALLQDNQVCFYVHYKLKQMNETNMKTNTAGFQKDVYLERYIWCYGVKTTHKINGRIPGL